MELLNKIKESIFGPTVDYKQLLIDGAMVVDVRTVAEFNSGHVDGSINIPMSSLLSNMERMRGKEIILVCRSGIRSQNAKGILKSNGIHAHNAGAWQNISKLSV